MWCTTTSLRRGGRSAMHSPTLCAIRTRCRRCAASHRRQRRRSPTRPRSGPRSPPRRTQPALRCRRRRCAMAETGGRVAARLTRLSFVDGARAGHLLSRAPLHWWDADATEPASDAGAVVIAAIGRSADPDAVLEALADLIATPDGAPLRAALEGEPQLRARLLGVLGVSLELAAHLRAHSADWRVLLGELDPDGLPDRLAGAVGADARDPVTGTAGTRARITGDEAVIALPTAYP